MKTNSSQQAVYAWLIKNGAELTKLSPYKDKTLKTKWRKSFANKLRIEKGVWRLGGYDWHLFSYNFVPTIQGFNAVRLIMGLHDRHWFIWGDRNSEFGYLVKNITPINLSNLYDDFILTSVDFVWTAAFTHESHCGPYYHKTD